MKRREQRGNERVYSSWRYFLPYAKRKIREKRKLKTFFFDPENTYSPTRVFSAALNSFAILGKIDSLLFLIFFFDRQILFNSSVRQSKRAWRMPAIIPILVYRFCFGINRGKKKQQPTVHLTRYTVDSTINRRGRARVTPKRESDFDFRRAKDANKLKKCLFPRKLINPVLCA